MNCCTGLSWGSAVVAEQAPSAGGARAVLGLGQVAGRRGLGRSLRRARQGRGCNHFRQCRAHLHLQSCEGGGRFIQLHPWLVPVASSYILSFSSYFHYLTVASGCPSVDFAYSETWSRLHNNPASKSNSAQAPYPEAIWTSELRSARTRNSYVLFSVKFDNWKLTAGASRLFFCLVQFNIIQWLAQRLSSSRATLIPATLLNSDLHFQIHPNRRSKILINSHPADPLLHRLQSLSNKQSMVNPRLAEYALIPLPYCPTQSWGDYSLHAGVEGHRSSSTKNV